MAKYDLVIIGSGPGGYVAAIRAGQYGLKTAVIEKDSYVGGTCLHIGCIPTKVLLHHAEIYDTFQHASEFGFDVKDVKVNWPAILARKEKIVTKHTKGIEFLFRKSKVETITGWGQYRRSRPRLGGKRRQENRDRYDLHDARDGLGCTLAAGRGDRRQDDSHQ